jgi:hypothetical protein
LGDEGGRRRIELTALKRQDRDRFGGQHKSHDAGDGDESRRFHGAAQGILHGRPIPLRGLAGDEGKHHGGDGNAENTIRKLHEPVAVVKAG